MAECYLCGCSIERGKGFRRRVQTGDSSGASWGRSVRAYSSTHYGLRTVCAACATRLAQQQERVNQVLRIITYVIGGLFLFVMLALCAHSGGGR